MKESYASLALPPDYHAAFKDADIRGVYPTEISEAVAYRVARLFVEHFGHQQVLVGRDMRVSSPALHEAFVAGAREAGADVIDLGLIDTPALYYASGTRQLPGVMITASHNPAEYNGLKLVQAEAVPLTNSSGLRDICRGLSAVTPVASTVSRGRYQKTSLTQAYRRYVQEKTPIKTPARPLRLVVDAGGGMGATVVPHLSGKALTVTPLFTELDGTFAARGSNPTLAKNQKPIVAEIQKGGYDFGVAFDGDADRVAFFDERGRYINGAIIGALITEYLAVQVGKQSYIYTVFTSQGYEAAIRRVGGRARKARVGHAFIKEQMRKHDAIFGCEHSGHFYFRDNFYADSGILTVRFVAAAVAPRIAAGETLSQIVAALIHSHQTEEVLITVSDKRQALQLVGEHFGKQLGAKPVWFDGVTITSAGAERVVVKQSVTEDALKFVVEAPTRSRATALAREVKQFLMRFAKAG